MSLVERLFPDAVIPSSRPDFWSLKIELSNFQKPRPGYTPKRKPFVECKKDGGMKSRWGLKTRDGHPQLSIRVGPVRLWLSWRATDNVCVDEWSGYHINCDHLGGTREHQAKRGVS